MPRFVLLHHVVPPTFPRPSHWDLMFEVGDSLRTWAIEKPLLPDAPQILTATKLANHRIEYLDYEGPVSNERGVVARLAHGEFEILSSTNTLFEAELRGENLSGVLRLGAATKSDWSVEWKPK